MRILIVENRSEDAEQIRDAIRARCPEASIEIAQGRNSARTALNQEPFDLLICDLSIPTTDGGLDEDPTHGWEVLAHCRDVRPGMPTCVLTGTRSDDHPSRVVEYGDQQDLFGTGSPEPVFRFFRKDRLTECLDHAARVASERAALVRIEVVRAGGRQLDEWEKRVIQVFGRRRRAEIVRAFELGGGLSGSRVIGFTTEDTDGRESRAVARIGTLSEITAEFDQYRTTIAGALAGHAYVTHVDNVTCGAGGLAGVFYELADGYNKTLFDVLLEDQSDAIQVAGRLRENLARWSESGRNKSTRVSEVRKVSVGDDIYGVLSDQVDSEACARLEASEVFAHWCRAHRDLHGGNVLVSGELVPVLIDFCDVGEATACLDPITLELSVLFHPGAADIRGHWPTVDQASTWADLDRFVVDCPVPDFIRECRGWANHVAAGEREVFVTAYAHALRQLKYDGVRKDVAKSVAKSAIAAALGTY